MQFDSLRAFPYPVLRPDVDDYTSGRFEVAVEFAVSEDARSVEASVDVELTVEEVQQEIFAGRAKYAVVFACRDTYYRLTHFSDEDEFVVDFPEGALRGMVEAYPFVVSQAEIPDFSSPAINTEFGPGPFSYEKGAVLAVDEPKAIYVDRDVFQPLGSLFQLVRDDSVDGYEWQVWPTDEKVQIAVGSHLKERLDAVRNNRKFKAVLMNSIYFGAVMQCISYLKEDEENANKKWGGVIKQRCEDEGIDLDGEDEYLVAQRLMNTPFELVDDYVFSGEDS